MVMSLPCYLYLYLYLLGGSQWWCLFSVIFIFIFICLLVISLFCYLYLYLYLCLWFSIVISHLCLVVFNGDFSSLFIFIFVVFNGNFSSLLYLSWWFSMVISLLCYLYRTHIGSLSCFVRQSDSQSGPPPPPFCQSCIMDLSKLLHVFPALLLLLKILSRLCDVVPKVGDRVKVVNAKVWQCFLYKTSCFFIIAFNLGHFQFERFSTQLLQSSN